MMVSNIIWDTETDGKVLSQEDLGLPSEIDVGDFVDEECIADYLSDEYGYCVSSYTVDDESASAERAGKLKVEFALTFAFDRPDRNGHVFSRDAVEKAVSSLRNAPIVFQRAKSSDYGVVVGNTRCDYPCVLWNEEQGVCEAIFYGELYNSGANFIINEMENGVIKDFRITSIEISTT